MNRTSRALALPFSLIASLIIYIVVNFDRLCNFLDGPSGIGTQSARESCVGTRRVAAVHHPLAARDSSCLEQCSTAAAPNLPPSLPGQCPLARSLDASRIPLYTVPLANAYCCITCACVEISGRPRTHTRTSSCHLSPVCSVERSASQCCRGQGARGALFTCLFTHCAAKYSLSCVSMHLKSLTACPAECRLCRFVNTASARSSLSGVHTWLLCVEVGQ